MANKAVTIKNEGNYRISRRRVPAEVVTKAEGVVEKGMHHIWDMPMSVDTTILEVEYNAQGPSINVWIQEPWVDGEKQEMDSTCRFHFLRTFDKVDPSKMGHLKTFRWGTANKSVHVFLEYL